VCIHKWAFPWPLENHQAAYPSIFVVNLLQIVTFVQIHMPVATSKMAGGVFISTPANL
jgi:hypothetical protein